MDAGPEHQAWLALQDLKGSGDVHRIDHIETMDTRDRAANIAYFAGAGYDIIVTTGAGIEEETAEVAKQHPAVLFIIVQPAHDAPGAPENVVKLEFREEEGGFLAGAVAAMITRTQRVAAVCESRYVSYVERYCEGFAAGVKFADEQVQPTVLYRSGADELLFNDTEWGKATAAQVVDDGADVVFAVGESTAGAALAQAARQGALVIGAQTDVFDEDTELREKLVTSAIPRVRDGLSSLLRDVLKGQRSPGSYWGNVDLAPFREFEMRLPPEAVTRLLTIRAALKSGALEAGQPFHTP